MGCATSKRIEVAVDVYRPPPTSFAVFDINAVDEPWKKGGDKEDENEDDDDDDETEEQLDKAAKSPQPILETKLTAIDGAPRSWDEVSKALEDLKPTLQSPKPPGPPQSKLSKTKSNNDLVTLALLPPAAAGGGASSPKRRLPRKSFSFHTLEELDSKLTSKDSSKPSDSKKSEFNKFNKFTRVESQSKQIANTTDSSLRTVVQSEGYKSVRENMFILKDKMELEKEGKSSPFIKFNPLSDYPEICPPNGSDSLVIYTTSLGGVRRTFEDCNKMRLILESHRAVFDERDVSLHAQFRIELRELLGEDASVPRLFVKGRYIGGVDEVVHLNETSKLRRVLNWARVERGVGRVGCEGCGGARFMPCLECGGSCKVYNEGVKERCPECNENGLIHCPICA